MYRLYTIYTIVEYVSCAQTVPNQKKNGYMSARMRIRMRMHTHTHTPIYKFWIQISLLLYSTLALNCEITNYFSFIPSYTVILHSLCVRCSFFSFYFTFSSLFFDVCVCMCFRFARLTFIFCQFLRFLH